MKKVLFNGAYTAPEFKELKVRCEAGFAVSYAGLDDLEGETGTWD